ncbi:MAG: hypothetical protein IPO30_22295 [Hyphomonadaceae bacterium]|nr:hypothetical protein [Hyphomonadaceae bacterium]
MILVHLVPAINPEGRDSAMLPLACLEINIRSSGGMSGGSALNCNGPRIGVLCTSIGDGEGGTSNIALTGPVLSVPFRRRWPTGVYPNPFALLAMGQICSIVTTG